MPQRASLVLIASLLCGACTHAPARTPAVAPPAKESSAMTSSPSSGAADQAAAPVSPKLSAEQMLSRLLTLIRTSRSVADFTPERLHEVMGVEMDYARDGSGRYGFGEKVSRDWVHGFEVDPRTKNHGFEFSFDPATRGSSPDMTSICQMDFDRFTGELEKMGFVREHHFDSPPQASFGEKLSHGALMYDFFQRPGMWIQVYPNGEANEPIEKISHLCVQMVVIG
ncbi:hypothetical protein [Xanthomonas sacchari]|uniref:Uncharacterized protein n=2 Tax=Xanthomonas sacchari TaxID=56458 RepID=A0AA46SUF7_9XANT|nr:hypothetical protein [Xanthomonas sacchari]UYK88745.1 hypothetical protein NG824_20160 [Xanthomonas sacchari]